MPAHERKIISIDPEKCNGCGLCVTACHEGAIQMVDGKAQLVSDVYCDGLGDCLGPCPTGAISIVTRKADAYDEEAVKARQAAMKQEAPLPCGCPGTHVKTLKPSAIGTPECGCPGTEAGAPGGAKENACCEGEAASELMNWPVKLDLIPPAAPYLKGADIVLAADCAPVAMPDFHRRHLRSGPVAIACPKLCENEPQIEKIAAIIRAARPRSLTVVRMQVPCCGGLVRVAEEAIRRSGIDTPLHVEVVGTDGRPVEAPAPRSL